MLVRQVYKRLQVLILFLVCLCSILGNTSTEATGGTAQTEVAESSHVAPVENILRVGVSTNAPPLIFKQGEEIVGLEAELAREFTKSLGKSIKFVELKWEEQIPALLEKRTDIIMSGMTITRMREIRIAFSKPYFRSGQMALIRVQDRKRFPNGYYSIYGSTSRLRFGVVKGTTGESFVNKNFNRAKTIKSFQTSREAVEALIKRTIDVVFHDAPIILMLASEKEGKGLYPLPYLLSEEYLAWGIRKGDAELLESANSFIEEIENDGRLDSILKRWIPLRN